MYKGTKQHCGQIWGKGGHICPPAGAEICSFGLIICYLQKTSRRIRSKHLTFKNIVLTTMHKMRIQILVHHVRSTHNNNRTKNKNDMDAYHPFSKIAQVLDNTSLPSRIPVEQACLEWWFGHRLRNELIHPAFNSCSFSVHIWVCRHSDYQLAR